MTGVELDPPPPHAVMHTAAAMKIKPRDAVSQTRPLPSRLLANNSGSRNTGNSTSAVAAPGSVSVKTTVIWYAPTGVKAEDAIVTRPVAAE